MMHKTLSVAMLLAALTLAPGTATAAPFGNDFGSCKPPPQVRRDKLKLEPLPARTQRMMSIAAADDVEACQADLRSAQVCRAGNIVVIDVGDAIRRAGRCERDPVDTEAYALRNAAYERILVKVPELAGHEDRYQSYVLWTDFKQTYSSRVPTEECQSCMLAFHFELLHPENGGEIVNIQGIGKPYNPYDQRVLHAIVNMWSIQDWTDEELVNQSRFDPVSILAHETEHDVCCYIRFIDHRSRVSNALIGSAGAHWSFYHNTYGQLMYGGNWREQGNGTFYSIAAAHGTRPLDLYLWGLIPHEEVPPVYYIETDSLETTGESCEPDEETLEAIKVDCADMVLDEGTGMTCQDDFEACKAEFNLCLEPPYYRTSDDCAGPGGCVPYDQEVVHSPTGIRAIGRKKAVTIDRILAAQQARNPDYKSSPKVNTNLFVLLVKSPDDLKQETLDRLDRNRRAFARKLYDVTGHRLRNVSSWDGTVDTPYWHWGGVSEWDGDTELEGWKRLDEGPAPSVKEGGLQLEPGSGEAAIVHDNVRIEGSYFDALQVTMRVPLKADEQGKPLLYHGKFVLEGDRRVEIPFPVAADGKLHEIVVHPPHQLIEKARCSGCVALCRNVDEEDEGWYDSCAGEVPTADGLLRAGECRTDAGLTACGPYCHGQGTDEEGWYDSCVSTVTGVFDKLTVVPISGTKTAEVGAIWIDAVDLFITAETVEEGDKKENGEKDDDGDGLINAFDNCPTVANPRQIDSNDDGEGDACGDFDADGIENALDNCPSVVNSLQQDEDDDGIGDACDPDYDADGACSVAASAAPPAGLLAALALIVLVGRLRARGSHREGRGA